MDDRTKGIKSRIQMGWTFLSAGAIVAAIGIFSDLNNGPIPRIVTGLGILSAGIGLGYLIRYGAAVMDMRAAVRVNAEVRDERTVMIRARAGNRAYWVSAAFIYIALMWESFASNGSLPVLAGDALWFYLVAGVLVPFLVYVGSIMSDQRRI